MFRFFVNPLGIQPAVNVNMRDLSELHPVTLEALLERCWNARVALPVQLGHPDRRSDVPGRPGRLLDPPLDFAPVGAPHIPPVPAGTPTINVNALDTAIQTFVAAPSAGTGAAAIPGIRWEHLIYAYMIENTRVVEVFRRVIDAFLHSERLGPLSARSQRWLWTTEELFYRDPPPFSTTTQTSSIRPQTAATRANAYQRLFGITLNLTDAAKPAFAVAEHANADFISVLDELLHEIWQGRSNFANQVGARPTDDAKIAELATRLSSMLLSRRTNGALSREEFMAVATMSWFHATLADGAHPILVDLNADAPSPEERLFKVAQKVGFPAHGLSKSYFEIAEPLSRLLTAIEQETYNRAAAVPALYTPTVAPLPPGPSVDTDTIMTHWSIIRGRDVKARKVATAAA